MQKLGGVFFPVEGTDVCCGKKSLDQIFLGVNGSLCKLHIIFAIYVYI